MPVNFGTGESPAIKEGFVLISTREPIGGDGKISGGIILEDKEASHAGWFMVMGILRFWEAMEDVVINLSMIFPIGTFKEE